jgi:hypothetical protein
MKEFKSENKDILKTIYICRDDKGLSDFLSSKFVSSDDLYIDKGMKLYKALNYYNPSILECYGFCNKQKKKNYKNLIKKFSNVKGFITNDMNYQLGGSILINYKGKIIFSYAMKYVGDYCKPEDIIHNTKKYFGIKEADNAGIVKVNQELDMTKNNNEFVQNDTLQLKENRNIKVDDYMIDVNNN